MRNYFPNVRQVNCFILCLNYMMFPLVLYPPSFEAVYCYISGRRMVAVARYRMFCLVLIYSLNDFEQFDVTYFGLVFVRDTGQCIHFVSLPFKLCINTRLFLCNFDPCTMYADLIILFTQEPQCARFRRHAYLFTCPFNTYWLIAFTRFRHCHHVAYNV